MQLLKSRTKAVLAGAVGIAVMSGGGVAVAAGAIGSADIKDDSIRSKDVRDGALRAKDLRASLQERIDAAGPAGQDGADGQDGASAYEVALANGFVGTEAEWLASLEGPAGADGAPGAPGAPGTPGAPGAPGPAVAEFDFVFEGTAYTCTDDDADLAYDCEPDAVDPGQ